MTEDNQAILDKFCFVAPFIHKLSQSDVSIGVTDREKYVYYLNATGGELPLAHQSSKVPLLRER